MPRLNAQNLHSVAPHKLAVSYQRVSTNRQGEEDRSGFSRQDAALANWRRINPEYEVRVIKEVISGKKNVKSGLLGQFLKDAQKGKVAPGTVWLLRPGAVSAAATWRTACSSCSTSSMQG